MDKVIALLGLMFFMFLVLSASVEVILEIFRGLLERFGITWAKGKISLDDALSLAAEFAPAQGDLTTKLQAVKSAASQIRDSSSAKLAAVEELKKQLSAAGANVSDIAAELNAVALGIKTQLEKEESQRVFVLRVSAALIGCYLAWYSHFYVFEFLAKSPDAKDFLGTLDSLQAPWINIVVGGFAAAAGSSYWHDQLDKVRNLKSAGNQFKKLAA